MIVFIFWGLGTINYYFNVFYQETNLFLNILVPCSLHKTKFILDMSNVASGDTEKEQRTNLEKNIFFRKGQKRAKFLIKYFK